MIAGGELDTAVVTSQLAREMDAAYATGEAALRTADPATRSRLLGPLDTSLLPGIDAQLFSLQQLHVGDPPAELADLSPVHPAVERRPRSAQRGGLTAQPPAALAAQLTAAYQPVSVHLDRLILKELNDGRTDHAAATAAADRIIGLILGTAAAGIAIAWLFLWYEVRRIRRSLEPVQDQAEFADTLQSRTARTRRTSSCSATSSARCRPPRPWCSTGTTARTGWRRSRPCRPARRWRGRCAARSRARAWRCGPAGCTASTEGGRLCSPGRCAPRCPAPRRAFRSWSAAR